MTVGSRVAPIAVKEVPSVAVAPPEGGTPATCACGYEFTTRDPRTAIERLERDARSGNRTWLGGFVAMIGLPVTFTLLPPMWNLTFALLQFAFASAWIVQGLVRSDRANKQLSAAKQLMALPEARVIQQSHPKARS